MSTPPDTSELAQIREDMADADSLAIGPGMWGWDADDVIRKVNMLLARGDYWRARCPVVAADIGPEHTAARVLAYARANGWREGYTFPLEGLEDPESQRFWVATFCNAQARHVDTAPHDVLVAIGAMP